MASSFAPRQEAVPFGWQKLSKDQQDIVRDMHRWLAGFMSKNSASGDSDGKKDNGDFLPRIELERESNVLLIDGGRGTGKTSVFLTLLQTWRDALDPSSARLPAIEDDEIAPVVQQRRIIPLDILDMQPLSGHPTLLLQLAGRLYRVARRLATNADEQTPEYPQRAGDAFPPSLQKWRELARVVAIAQEDDPHLRRSQNNPEDFAIELESAERQRAYLGERWHDFVDTLWRDVKDYADRLRPLSLGSDPVFIVPIDDADMNPERGVELLELLRSLWHPRVVFLLTGDAGLFRTLLFNHYKKICKWMPGIMARNLAHDVLGKVIPPAQRLRCRVQPNEAFEYLKGAAVLPPAIIERVERAALKEAFPRRWRVLRDLEQSLKAQRLAPIEAAKVLFEEAVKGSALTDADKDHLLSSCFKPARRGKGFRVDENVITMQPQTQQRTAITFDDHRSMSWGLNDGDRWLLRRGSSAALPAADDTADSLPDSIAESLYLAASLASEPTPKKEQNKDDAKDEDEMVNVRLGRALSPKDYALPASTFSFGPVAYTFPWPTPQWHDPLDFRRFLTAWREVLGTQLSTLGTASSFALASDAQREAAEALAAWWLTTICALADRTWESRDARTAPTVDDWRSIGTRVASLARRDLTGTPQGLEYIWWARTDAMFFAAKESPLRVDARNALCDGWLLGMSSFIEKTEKDNAYWHFTDLVINGRQNRITSAAGSDSVLDAAVRHAVPYIRATTLREVPQKDDVNRVIERLCRYANENPESPSWPVIMQTAMDGMGPNPSGYIENVDSYASLFSGKPGARRGHDAHYGRQVQLQLSKCLVLSIPPNVDAQWANLWRRISEQLGNVTTNLAKQTDLLARLRGKSAREASLEMMKIYLNAADIPNGQSILDLASASLTGKELFPRVIGYSMDPENGYREFSLDNGKLSLSWPKFDWSPFSYLENDMIRSDYSTVMAMLSNYSDIIIDESDAAAEASGGPSMDANLIFNGSHGRFLFPLPDWLNYCDRKYVFSALDGILHNKRPLIMPTEGAPSVFGIIIRSIMNIYLGRKAPSPQWFTEILNTDRPINAIEDSLWGHMRKFIQEWYGHPPKGRRAQAAVEWVSLAGPLFAAPETGMSPESAERWLGLWTSSSGEPLSPAMCKKLSDFRLERAHASIGKDATQEQAKTLLAEVDAKHPDHPWVRLIEARAKQAERA